VPLALAVLLWWGVFLVLAPAAYRAAATDQDAGATP
jgi:predicted secreted protein